MPCSDPGIFFDWGKTLQNFLALESRGCYLRVLFVQRRAVDAAAGESDTRPFKAGCRRLGAVAHQPMAERRQRDRVIGSSEDRENGLGLGLGDPRVTPG